MLSQESTTRLSGRRASWFVKIMNPMTLENDAAQGIRDPGPPMVAIVDDDASVRRSTQRLLWSSGICANAFASAEESLVTVVLGRTSTTNS